MSFECFVGKKKKQQDNISLDKPLCQCKYNAFATQISSDICD